MRGARVNLASKRVTVEWRDGELEPEAILDRLSSLGYPAYPFAAANLDNIEAAEEKRLLRCLGVAAFGAMNVMLISVALWSGAADASAWATRDFFHWLSALVVLPSVAYAGRPFFDSAMKALRQFSFNMDVPITIGVTLALALSVVQTLQHARDAYFDSAIMLVLFLLAGRYLDQRMRRRTRDVASNLAAIKAETATKLSDDGEARETPIAAISAGDLVLARAGDRIAVDGMVEEGRSEIDQSLVTGETAAIAVAPGAMVYAGTLNLAGALRIRVSKAAEGTLLDEVNRLLERAIEQRSSYVQLADRASRLYTPVVHLTALTTFIGWLAARPVVAAGSGDRDHRADHHLSLRARPRRAGGAGGGGERDVPPRRDAQFRRRPRAARRRRHDRVRQDRHVDAAAVEPRQSRRLHARRAQARRFAGAGEQTPAGQGGRRRGERDRPARRARIPGAGRHRLPRGQAAQARLARLLQGGGGGGGGRERNGPTRR